MKKVKIDPSELKHKIGIWEYKSIVNDFGDTREGYTEILSTVAKMTEKTNFNQLTNDQGDNQNFVKRFHFDIRGRKGFEVTDSMYIKYNGGVYKVLGYTELSTNPHYIKITTIRNESDII